MNPSSIRPTLWVLAAVATLVACGAFTEQSRHAQTSTARVSQEVACQKHLKRFLDGKD
jgi:hypothetical protein